jgi:hypothetical protein
MSLNSGIGIPLKEDGMSRDLEIRSDDSYSQGTHQPSLYTFLVSLPNVHMLTNRFGEYEVPQSQLYMAIYLVLYDKDGTLLDLDDPRMEGNDCVNALQLHVAAAHAAGDRMQQYEKLGLVIAQHLGWHLYDCDSDMYLDPNSASSAVS